MLPQSDTSAITTRKSSPKPRKVPCHVAIIMDGNGRWAEQQGLPRLAGHRVGMDRIQRVLEILAERGVAFVTLYPATFGAMPYLSHRTPRGLP